MAGPVRSGIITCSTNCSAPAVVHGAALPSFGTPTLVTSVQDRLLPPQMISNVEVYDDQGNLRLSAVRNGPAAGLGETGPCESTFTYTDPAAIGDLEPQGGQIPYRQPAVPMDGDRVPLRDQGTPLRAPGQYAPLNTTIHHSHTENLDIHNGDSEYSYDDDEGSESGEKSEGREEDECDEIEPDDHIPHPMPVRDDETHDQVDPYTIRQPSYLAHGAMSNGGTASENLRPGSMKRRQSSMSHPANDVPSYAPLQNARHHDRIEMRSMDMDSRYHTTPELPPLENRNRKTLRANPAHFQVVHQPAVDPTWYDNYRVDAPGMFETISGTSDAHQYATMDALVNAPGTFGSTPDTLDAEPYAAVNVSNLTTSRVPQHLLQHGEASPVSRPPRYAQTNTQPLDWLHEQLVCGNRTGLAMFPPMGRTQVGPNPTVPLQDHDRSEDNSRSLRGHRRAGQAQYEEDSHNLTNDLNEMLTTTGASITEFRSPISSPDRVVVGGVRGIVEQPWAVTNIVKDTTIPDQ